MDELVSIMEEIRDLLSELNQKIDRLTDYNTNQISDIIASIENLMGFSKVDLADISNKLDALNELNDKIDKLTCFSTYDISDIVKAIG